MWLMKFSLNLSLMRGRRDNLWICARLLSPFLCMCVRARTSVYVCACEYVCL